MHRFLIDECLSPGLAGAAKRRGYHALHVIWADRAGHSDHSLMPYILGGDYIFVTNNGADFRYLYRALDIHPGLIVLLPRLRRKEQVTVFEKVLDRLDLEPDLINKLMIVDAAAQLTVADFPQPGGNT